MRAGWPARVGGRHLRNVVGAVRRCDGRRHEKVRHRRLSTIPRCHTPNGWCEFPLCLRAELTHTGHTWQRCRRQFPQCNLGDSVSQIFPEQVPHDSGDSVPRICEMFPFCNFGDTVSQILRPNLQRVPGGWQLCRVGFAQNGAVRQLSCGLLFC